MSLQTPHHGIAGNCLELLDFGGLFFFFLEGRACFIAIDAEDKYVAVISGNI